MIIRGLVPRQKSPFPMYFKGFPAVSHLIPPFSNTLSLYSNNLGVFTTDESGKTTLTDVNRDWYKLVEESSPKGFGIQGSGVTEFYLEANASKTVTVDNVPLSALVVYKYDAKTVKGLEGCRFDMILLKRRGWWCGRWQKRSRWTTCPALRSAFPSPASPPHRLRSRTQSNNKLFSA